MSQLSPPSPSSPPPGLEGARTERTGGRSGLSGLARMSTTAGVGLQDYRAVNAFAVAALVCGLASWMSWLHPLLYVVPALAMMFGLVALVQIRRSNGTQGGTLLAAAGVVLGLLIGGTVLVRELMWRAEARAHRADIEQALGQFGEALSRGDLAAAYGMTSERFQSEFAPPLFAERFNGLQTALGRITSAHSNGRAQIRRGSDGSVSAEAIVIYEHEQGEPYRDSVALVRTPDGWRLHAFERMFPRGRR